MTDPTPVSPLERERFAEIRVEVEKFLRPYATGMTSESFTQLVASVTNMRHRDELLGRAADRLR